LAEDLTAVPEKTEAPEEADRGTTSAAAAPAESSNGAYEPRQEEPIEATPLYPGSDDSSDESWSSASDEGWQAAQSLLEAKNEEVTTAGLPKRVPNAYLVPGSIGSPSESSEPHNSFTDATSGLPGTGAMTRSASAARSRMASFQRGYTSGRHALKDRLADDRLGDDGVPVSGSGYLSDSSEERQ
jgi:hypothetical protein